ncbi:MAG: NAD(+)/NADH kinase [Candidatus Hodarchaeota archaeon]
MFKTVGVKAKPDEKAIKISEDVVNYLEKQGLEVKVSEETARKMTAKVNAVELSEMNVEFLVTVGGDGTILRTLHNLPAVYPPILGINVGSIGFLAEICPEDMFEALDRILKGDFILENALQLKASASSKKIPNALNEVAVMGKQLGKILRLEVYVNDNYISTTLGDGVMVATPTGSTAYCLSSGGPIIEPSLEGFAIVPISTFRTSMIPLVVPSSSVVNIHVAKPNKDALAIVDGQHQTVLKPGDEVIVQKAEEIVPFIRFEGSFYRRLRDKFLIR